MARALKENCKGILFEEKPDDVELTLWAETGFFQHMPLVFICAVGIAVRTVAPLIENKLLDSPVIVIDELGKHVIPILSGHYGGGNTLAKELAQAISATAVITTATDLYHGFAIDIFAKKNGLHISDKDGIKAVSSRVLQKKTIGISLEVPYVIEGEVPSDVTILQKDAAADVYVSDEVKEAFTLCPKRLVLGMGCKKEKDFTELLDFVTGVFGADELRENLYAIATVDRKEEEVGLLKLAQYFGAGFFTYTSEKLRSVKGDFPASAFVEETVGVSNVCERAAVLGAGLKERKLRLEKTTGDGMTLAAAERKELVLRF